MKYLVVVALALINFVLQANDRPQADLVAYAADYSASSGAAQFIASPEIKSDKGFVELGSNRLNVEPAVAAQDDSLGANFVGSSNAQTTPGFIWIFGSLVAGLLAFALSRHFSKNTGN